MPYRVVIAANIPNLVVATRLTHERLANLIVTGGAERQLVLTIEGTNALDAGTSALRRLGDELL